MKYQRLFGYIALAYGIAAQAQNPAWMSGMMWYAVVSIGLGASLLAAAGDTEKETHENEHQQH